MKTLALFLCLQGLAFALLSVTNSSWFSVSNTNVLDLSGEGAYEIFPGKSWQFVGPTRQVALGAGQKLAASATAVLGTNSGTTRAAVAICYQRSPTDPITPFVGDNHLNVTIDNLQRPYTAAATGSSAFGTINVGFCVVNLGKEIIGNNNYVNGWLLISE